MALLRDRIPNKRFTGPEISAIVLEEVKRMLDSEYYTKGSAAYGRVALKITITADLGHPHGVIATQSRFKRSANEGPFEGEAPLNPMPEDGGVLAKERTIVLQDPNLERIHHGLPIKEQIALPPRPPQPENPLPGDNPPDHVLMIPHGFKDREYKYDPNDYPEGAQPEDVDVSEREAELLRTEVRRGSGSMGLGVDK